MHVQIRIKGTSSRLMTMIPDLTLSKSLGIWPKDVEPGLARIDQTPDKAGQLCHLIIERPNQDICTKPGC